MIGLLEQHVHGYGFAFGDPTPEYKERVFGRFYVQRGQWAASVRWDVDEAARDVQVKLGPVGLALTFARRRLVDYDWTKEKSTLRVRALKSGRELHTWRNWRHLGVCVDVDPAGRMWRVEAGPFGVAVSDS